MLSGRSISVKTLFLESISCIKDDFMFFSEGGLDIYLSILSLFDFFEGLTIIYFYLFRKKTECLTFFTNQKKSADSISNFKRSFIK